MLRLFSMRVCEFTIIHTRVGGYGFLSRCARAIFCLGFWCFGEQVFAPIVLLRVLRFWSNIYACWWLRVLNPLCTCRYYFFLAFASISEGVGPKPQGARISSEFKSSPHGEAYEAAAGAAAAAATTEQCKRLARGHEHKPKHKTQNAKHRLCPC